MLGIQSIPDWFDPNLYAPNLGMPAPALSQAMSSGTGATVGSGRPSPAPVDQASAVGSVGNGALGQAMGAPAVDQGAVSNALQGIDPNDPSGGLSGVGYNGSVNTIADFAKAIASGAGVVFGGLPGMIGLGLGAIGGFKNGTGLAPNLLAMLGLTGGSTPGVLGNIMNSTSAGPLGSKDLEIGSSLGDSMGPSGGQDRGSQGDRTAELRGMAEGGALSAAMRRRKR